MPEVTRCARCIMPTSWRGLTLNTDGVCNQCTTYDARQNIDWAARGLDFRARIAPLVKQAQDNGSPYDCIVGFSGGKDSSWVLYRAVTQYGLKPLAVTFDHGFRHDEASGFNIREIPKRLNVDHITMNVGDGLRNRMVNIGIDQVKDFCVHCHRGVGAFTARMATFYDTPLVLWGEPAYTDMEETASGYEHFKKWFDCGLTDIGGREFHAFQYPANGIAQDVYLGNYELWDQWEHADILDRELGWRRVRRQDVPESCKWDKVDCVMEPIRGWQGWLKGGVGRGCFNLSKAIRKGLITREEALEELKRLDGHEPITLMYEFATETNIGPDIFKERITK